MKSFSNSSYKHFVIATYEKYGDLVNSFSIALVIIESVILGLRLDITVLVTMMAMFAALTLTRFFVVYTSNESTRKQKRITTYRWTIYSAILTGIIWGGSCFFYPTSDPFLFIIHILFLLLIALLLSIFFSSIPVLSVLLTGIILSPAIFFLFQTPVLSASALPAAVLLASTGLMTSTLFHSKMIHAIHRRIARQRKTQLKLSSRERRIRALEQTLSTQEGTQVKGPNEFTSPDSSTKLLPQFSNEAVALLTADGHILRTNHLFREITNHKKITVGTTVFSHLFPKEMIDNLEIALQTAVSTSQEISFSTTYMGKLRRILFIPSTDIDNNILDITMVIDDVTQQQDKTDLPSQTDRIWDALFSLTSIPDDQQTWQSFFSPIFPALCQILGADRVIVAGLYGDLIDSSNPPIHNQSDHSFSWIFSIESWLATLLDGEIIHDINSSFSEKVQNLLKEKGIKTLALKPIFLGSDFWGVFAIIKTTTSHNFPKQKIPILHLLGNILTLQLALEKSQTERKQLATIVEQSEDCIMITDPGKIVQYANPASAGFTGYAPNELLGTKAPLLNMTDNRHRIWEEVDTSLKQKKKWHGQFLNKRKDHSLYEEEMIISPIYDHSGDMVDLVIVKRNITEAKRLESIAEAANLMDNIGFIFSSLRHELGNPINSLKVSLSILESNLDNYDREDIKRFLSRNLSDIKRVEYILTTLRNFSVFEKPEVKPVNMVDMITQFTNLIRPDVQKKDIKLEVRIPNSELIGLVDARAFQQVLLNLTTNAMDALENIDRKRLTISMYQEENSQISLKIGDNGCGIDQEELSSLFKPFFTTKAKGTGLGLVIVKKMLTKMNCSINVHSKKSVGTQVVIIIPGQKSKG